MPLAGGHTDLAASWISLQNGSSASLITWTINGTSASGNLTESSLNSTGLSIDANTYPFTGVISGSAVTLSFSGGSTVTGSVSAHQLQLQIADSTGTMQSYVFTPGTTSAYNAAVKLIQSVVNANQLVASANQKISTEETTINAAAQTVSSDVSSIASDISNLNSSISSLQADLSSMATDLQTTKTGAAVVSQDVNTKDNSACGDAGSVQGDAGSVQGDLGTLQGDEDLANTYLTSLKSALSSLPSDWSTYQRALVVVPNYSSQYAVAASQEQSALAQGSSESSQFSTKESQMTSSGQSILNRANQIAASAMTEASNGTSGGC